MGKNCLPGSPLYERFMKDNLKNQPNKQKEIFNKAKTPKILAR